MMTDEGGMGGNFTPWWEESDSECALRCAVTAVNRLDDEVESQNRLTMFDRYERAYDARKYIEVGQERANFNVIQAVTDAAVAQLMASPASVMVLTERGSAQMQKRGKKLTAYLKGQFENAGHNAALPQTAHYGALFGTGSQSCSPGIGIGQSGAIGVRSVDPRNIIVHPSTTCGRSYFDARGRGPSHLYESIECPLDTAIAAFPRKRAQLEEAGIVRQRDQQRRERGWRSFGHGASVMLLDSWWCGWSKRRNRHHVRRLVGTNNTVLLDEEMEMESIPFAFFRWDLMGQDFYGRGIADKLMGIQVELDALCAKIVDHMRLATSQIWQMKGSSQNSNASNMVFSINTYTTQPPTVLTMPPIDPAYFQERARLVEQAFSVCGVTQMAASGMKPAGLNSGRSIRLYKDIANQRLVGPIRRMDRLSVEMGVHLIAAAKAIDEAGEGGHRIMAQTSKGLEAIDWSDVDMDRDQFKVAVAATNFLDTTPSGKMDGIAELLQQFPQAAPFAMNALDYPDLEAFTSLANARYDAITLALDGILADGIPAIPDPNTDLANAVPIALAYLARAQTDGEPEERIDMLREYLEAASALSEAAAQAAQPPPAPSGAQGPTGAPMGPPPPGMMPQGMM